MENNIKHLRQDKGFSQTEVANKLDVSREFVSRVENGKQKCSVKFAMKLCQILDCTLNDIFLN